jgi:Domain of unknown function (DUF4129)
MADATFTKSNPGWQFELLKRQFGEWIELKLRGVRAPLLPEGRIPPQLLEVLFWVLVVALSAWLCWKLLPRLEALWLSLQQPSDLQNVRGTGGQQDYSVVQWLQQARDLQQQGNYGAASRALYMAMLQRLHDAKLILHHPSRSDGEYLGLTQQLPRSESYQTLIQTHEQVCFGNAAMTEDAYLQCQQAYQEIEPQ